MRFLIIAICFLSLAGTASAGSNFLPNAVATGAGPTFTNDPAVSRHRVDCNITDTNGSITGLVVALRSTEDAGTNWNTLATHTFTGTELAAKAAFFVVTESPATKVRANITSIGGTVDGTDIINCYYTPGN